MYSGPALYKGKVGSTGTSTAPHAHFRLTKDGKEIPLSTARSDIGQYLQFRLPGQQDWQSLYTKKASDYLLNPAAPLTSPMGMRKHPIHGDMRHHGGEDYGLPEGTQLRFLGEGSVATHANRGGAGNVASLRTGPYELETFHLSELPEVSTTRGKLKKRPTESTETTESDSDSFDDLLNEYIENQFMQQLLEQATSKPTSPFERFAAFMSAPPPGVMRNVLTTPAPQQNT